MISVFKYPPFGRGLCTMKNSAISALRKISLHNVFPFLTIVQITAVLIWMIYLCQHTDSLYSIYVLCAVCSLFFLLLRLFKRLPENRKSRFLFPAAFFLLLLLLYRFSIAPSVPYVHTLRILKSVASSIKMVIYISL